MSANSKIISADGLTGNISLSKENGLHIKLHLTLEKPIAKTDVIKLNLTSSSRSDHPPLNCGTAEGEGKDFRLTKNIVNPSPYSADEIDTAEIISKNVFTEEITPLAKISFAEEKEDYPDLDAIREKLSYLKENEFYKAYLDTADSTPSPMETAEETLKDLYKVLTPTHHEGADKVYMEYIREFADKQIKADFPIEGYEWYRCAQSNPPINASAMEHIFAEVEANLKKYGHWILGIKNDENIICIAIPTGCDEPNPLPHIDDCTVYIPSSQPNTEYCTVCISFQPDGQYFMPIC